MQENSASPGKLWVTYSLPGLRHQGSPRSLGLVTGRQCDRAASHQLFVDILHASVSTPVLPNLFSERGEWGQGSSVYPSEHPYQAPPEWPSDSGVVSHHFSPRGCILGEQEAHRWEPHSSPEPRDECQGGRAGQPPGGTASSPQSMMQSAELGLAGY